MYLFALAAEGTAFILQKKIQKHSMTCTCNSCFVINAVLLTTLKLVWSTRK